MVLYKCFCGYETKDRTHIKRHLYKITPCTPNIDLKNTNIDTLCVERERPVRKNISILTIEEKQEYKKQQVIYNTEKRTVGKMSINQFASKLLAGMISSCNRRNHPLPSWRDLDIVKMLENNTKYIVFDTILGDLEFPMMLTNGYYNTASFDRIDDKLGYFKENIEIRPYFLNTNYKLTSDLIKEIIKLREQKKDLQNLIDISNFLNRYNSTHFFYLTADRIKFSKKGKDNFFKHHSIKKIGFFLIKKFIEQGGRCAYSNIPMLFERKHPFKLSVERVNPLIPYDIENIALIVVGLNGKPSGQFRNKNLSEEQTIEALEKGKFNQEYWDSCTKITPEIKQICENIKEYEKTILLENLSKEIKLKIDGLIF